jgi:hypothetical protein
MFDQIYWFNVVNVLVGTPYRSVLCFTYNLASYVTLKALVACPPLPVGDTIELRLDAERRVKGSSTSSIHDQSKTLGTLSNHEIMNAIQDSEKRT